MDSDEITLELPETQFNVPLPNLKKYKYQKDTIENLNQSLSGIDKQEEYNQRKTQSKMESAQKDPKLEAINADDGQPEPSEDPEITEIRADIIRKLEQEHYAWDCKPKKLEKAIYYNKKRSILSKDVYKFDLFESNFDEETNVPTMDLPVYRFKSERQKLNSAQIRQIWKSRTFEVESEMKNLPHVWKVTPCLLNSSKGKNSFMQRACAIALRLMFCIPNSWNCCGERVMRYRPTKSISKPNILNVIMCLFFFFLNLLDFFFGVRFRVLNNDYSTRAGQRLRKIVRKRFASDWRRFPKLSRLVQFLRPEDDMDPARKGTQKYQKELQRRKANLQKFKSYLEKIGEDFKEHLNREIQAELDKEDFDEKEVQEIQKDFQERQQEMYMQFIQKQTPERFPVIYRILVEVLRARVIYLSKKEEMEHELKNARQQMHDDFKRNRKVFARIKRKMRKDIDKRYRALEKQRKAQFHANIISEFEENGFSEPQLLMEKYLKYREDHPALYKQEIKLERRENMRSINKFKPMYPLRHDQWEVKSYRAGHRTHYYADQYGSVTITSRYFFYKLTKAVVTYFLKVYTVSFWLLKYFWDGKFGIKGLFCCSDFFRHYAVDIKTGEIAKNKERVRPFLRKFLGVIHGIQKSRKRFEEKPDDGLFGKGLGRFCNLFECGIIRFFFFGVIVVLIIHPIINVIVIVMCLVLTLTSVVWLLPVEILLLTFKLLIYDYKSTLRGGNHYKYNPDYFFEWKVLKFVRSYRYFTLFRLVFDLVINVPVQFCMVFCMIIFNPIIALLILFFSGLLYVIKNVIDWIVLRIIIAPCARVPSSNTAYAQRIKGPGISRDFYCSIENEHLSLLVLSHLEQIRLRKLEEETIARLEYPRKHIKEHTQEVLRDFYSPEFSNKFITRSTKNLDYLKKSLKATVKVRIDNLPKLTGGVHTVRFTKESLEKNLMIIRGVLSEAIEEYEMEGYIWEKYSIKKGHFNRLSRAVLSDVLTPSAMIPVEDVDRVNRVKYKKTKVVDYVNRMMDDQKLNNRVQRIKRIRQKKIYHQNHLFCTLANLTSFYSSELSNWNDPFEFLLTKVEDSKANANPEILKTQNVIIAQDDMIEPTFKKKSTNYIQITE